MRSLVLKTLNESECLSETEFSLVGVFFKLLRNKALSDNSSTLTCSWCQLASHDHFRFRLGEPVAGAFFTFSLAPHSSSVLNLIFSRLR